MSGFNDRIIAEFRANGGRVETAGFGSSLVLLHTIGAKSGVERISPVMGIPQPDGSWLVAASAAGAPDNPARYANLLGHPEVAVEVGVGDTIETIDVRAEALQGEARDAGWAQFTRRSPGFRDYEAKAGGRLIPVVKLSRR
ncbi:nitroreductase/quinone reductase family protein [Subtercola sp. YIM 133946]|uniref:nitroreductase/quinone reductase family protein n=1 Tax=Subtercola sp. YIM 133946 TaxID=3118909 RepID=UPI002F93940F